MTTAAITAGRLFDALKAAGFELAGIGWGHVRVTWPGEQAAGQRSLVLILDDTAPEYAEMLAAALEVLRAEVRRGEAARRALDMAGEVEL